MYLKSKTAVKELLSKLLLSNDSDYELEEIKSLKFSSHEGSFPAFIIDCKMQSGQTKILRLKYSTSEIANEIERNGIEYEGMVYNRILKGIPLTTAKYYGSVKDENSDSLLLEYLENSTLIKHSEPEAFTLAAKWIASFHKMFEGKNFSFLKQINEDYLLCQVEKVNRITANNKALYWFKNLCSFYQDNIHVLLTGTNTVIHGEYYGKNILIRDQTIYPVDWEACAYGPQEIDLAALLDGKDDERIQLAIANYKATRYPDVAPEIFEKKLNLAELYLKLRWISEWVTNENELKHWFTDERFYQRLRKFAIEYNCI